MIRLILVPFLLVLVSLKSQAEEVYKVGATLPLTGAWSNWGEDIRNGLVLSSRVTKNKFTFDFQDDQCSGKVALGNINKFNSMEQLTTIFAGCVEILDAIGPKLDQRKNTLITLGGMEKRILKRNPTITSFSSLTDSEAYFLVPYLTQDSNVSSIVLVNGTNLFGETIGTTMKDLLSKSRIKVSAHFSVDLDTSDFKSIISRIVASNSDAVWIHQGDSTIGTFLRQLKAGGFKGQVFSVYTLENLPLKDSNPNWLNGVKYTFPSESTKFALEIENFNEEYRKEFNTPIGVTSKIAYDALQVLDIAITKCKGMDNVCINKFLRSLSNYQGLSGEVTIYPDGSAIRPHGLKEFRDGKFIWLEKSLPVLDPN